METKLVGLNEHNAKLIKNPVIYNSLSKNTECDLSKSNRDFGIIVCHQIDSGAKLQEIFDNIINGSDFDFGYYYLTNIFKNSQMSDPEIVVVTLINTINKKLGIIQEAIYGENKDNVVTFGIYNQIWENYKNFTKKIHSITTIFKHHLLEKKINTGKIVHDVLSVLHICMFFNTVFTNTSNLENQDNTHVLNSISDEICSNSDKINKHNIDQLLDYIDSIRAFIMMRNYSLIINENNLIVVIKKILSYTNIVNILCYHLNELLLSLTDKNLVHEFNNDSFQDKKKVAIKKIYKIATILGSYVDPRILMIVHKKYMQSRIMNFAYDNLELEIEIIKRFSIVLGREKSQNLIDIIGDIIQSRQLTQNLKNVKLNITTEKYKMYPDISQLN